FTNLKKVLPLKDNLTADNNAWWVGNKAHNRKSAHALTTGALTDQTYAFTLIDNVRESVNCS
ncbi:MAG: hypothetical protein HYU83_06840, partial [Chloroflexi bacterium]|nr:hypothetical protein [Chloroflexota bacterium]